MTGRPIGACGTGKRIYLAGFDVFRIDAQEHGRFLQRTCDSLGFVGVYPLDSEVPAGLRANERAAWIYRANVAAIRGADIVMANLNDFRGIGEPDSGTAFEIGYAAALGKEIWAYRPDSEALLARVPTTASPFGDVCERGFLVEDFDLPLNLMIACASRIVTGGPGACLEAIAAAGLGAQSTSLYRQDGGSEIRLVEG